jgi:calcium/calmodulin-dependent protein kinase (CaM kinase) II
MNNTGDAMRGELIELTRRLLKSIVEGDWATYAELCDPEITAFEPEAAGHLVQGMDFHHFYFSLPGGAPGPRNTTLASPQVWMLGRDAGVVAYVRLTQKLDASGAPVTVQSLETRVWHRKDGRWKHVHFHRS